MPRPKKTAGETTRARLLRAAEVEFGAVGFDRARLEDIAAAAGIRRASLLYHFPSKEALYAEVVTSITRQVRGALELVMAGDAPVEVRIEHIGETLIRFAEQHRAAVSMFVRELLDAPAGGVNHIGEFVAIVESIEQFISREAAHLIPAGAPTRAVLLHLMTSQALRIASGSLGDRLWGEAVDPRAIVRALLTPR